MRQRRYMAMFLIAMFMTWTFGFTAMAKGPGTNSTPTSGSKPGSVVEQITGGGSDKKPGGLPDVTTQTDTVIPDGKVTMPSTTTGSAFDITPQNGTGTGGTVVTPGKEPDVTTQGPIIIVPEETVEIVTKSAVALNTSSVKVSKSQVGYGEAVQVTLITTINSVDSVTPSAVNVTPSAVNVTPSAVNLSPSAVVCYTTGSGKSAIDKKVTLLLQQDGTYTGTFNVDETIKAGTWVVKYTIFKDSLGKEIKSENQLINKEKGIDLSAGDIQVLDDYIYGFSGITVSKNVSDQVDNIEVTVSALADSTKSLGKEAYVCYTTGAGASEVEKKMTLTLGEDGNYKGFFSVDEQTARGVWKVKYVIVSSRSGNVMITYNTDASPEVGMGSSMKGADITVPELEAPKVKEISVSSNSAYASDKVEVKVLTTYDSDKIKYLAPEAFVSYTIGSGVLAKENKITLKLEADGSYKGFFYVDEFSTVGAWRPSYVIVGDVKDNVSITYNSDVHGIGQSMSVANIKVIGDKLPQFGSITVNNSKAQSGDKVVVSLALNADPSVVLSPEASVGYTVFTDLGEIEKPMTLKLESDGVYRGIFYVDESVQPGTWKPKFVVFEDNKGNVKVVYNANTTGLDVDMTTGEIEVAAQTVPELTGIVLSKSEAGSGEKVEITLTTSATTSAGLAKEAYVSYTIGTGANEIENKLALKVNEDGTYKGAFLVDDQTAAGIWRIKYIVFGDDKENVRIIYNAMVNGFGADLSVGNIKISDNAKFKLTGLSIDNPTPKMFEKVGITVQASVENGTLADEATICYTLMTNNGPVDKNVSLKLQDGKYSGTLDITKNIQPGAWRVSYLILETNGGSVAIVYNTLVHGIQGANLSAGDFNYVAVKDIQITSAATEVDNGKTVQLSAKATLTDGKVLDLAGSAAVTWSASKGTVVDGLYTAPTDYSGPVTVTAQYEGVKGNATVTVVAKVSKLNLTPLNAEVESAKTLQYKLEATYTDGKIVDVTTDSAIAWSVDKGTIVKGLYTAPSDYIGNINVTAQFSGITATLVSKVVGKKYEVKVNNGTGAGLYVLYAKVTVKPDLKGQKFGGWVDESGKIVSYQQNYSFELTRSITLTAITATTDVTAKPLVTLDDNVQYDTTNSSYVTITVQASFTVPQGCNVTEKGYIIMKDMGYDPGELLTLNSAGITKVKNSATNGFGQAALQVKARYGVRLYIRGYIKYKTTNGETVVYSTNIVKPMMANR